MCGTMSGHSERQATIERIRNMEQCFNEILAAKEASPETFLDDMIIKRKLTILMDYYENGQWLMDYERDERGELPADLKRGVLSQDAVFDLLSEIADL